MVTPLCSFTLLPLLLLLLLQIGSSFHANAKLVLEEGYTVTTFIDGHKLNIKPRAVLPSRGSSDLIVLDDTDSVFYTLSFPPSHDGGAVVKRLSGNGKPGFSDGELGLAQFDKPTSFAVDTKGNIYVADRRNNAVRKITSSGVTTIAGGYSQKEGHEDGPAQNASFSNNFELVFAPERCAILIADIGNLLVRQIDLRPEDCGRGSQSVLGAVSLWVLGLGLSCLFGVVIGIVMRPYIIPCESFSPLHFSKTWKHFLLNLVRQVPMPSSDIRNAVARSSVYALVRRLLQLSFSHLSLMFRINYVHSQVSNRDTVSLLDSDVKCHEVDKSEMFADQLKDLIGINDCLELSNCQIPNPVELNEGRSDASALADGHGRIDKMIQANIMGFGQLAEETSSLDQSFKGSLGLVKRK